jgi:hypothetical protein
MDILDIGDMLDGIWELYPVDEELYKRLVEILYEQESETAKDQDP